MGIVRMGVPKELVLFLQRTFSINVFIETGTFKGDTCYWASDHFKIVFTIELSKQLFDEVVDKYQHRDNINFICGDSSKEIKKILENISESAVIWLDAHHCSMNSAGKGLQAPILDEINAINSSVLDHIILIDDARLFLAPPPDPHSMDEYPDIFTLLENLNHHRNKYVLIYDDVIICVPESTKKIVSSYCKQQITQVYWTSKASQRQNDHISWFVFQIKTAARGIYNFFRQKRIAQQKWYKFKNDFRAFIDLNKNNNRFVCRWEDCYPCLDDATINTSYDRHYVLHPVWAMQILAKNKPDLHIDIGSALRFVVQLSCIVLVRHYDYRPPLLSIDNLECGKIDLTDLPFEDSSISSLSCMHTIEHVGLGRYGDPLDSEGDIKASSELTRVLRPGGNLLVVVPVGRSRIEFNAHRIYSYCQALGLFPLLKLKEYTLIPDSHEMGDLLHGASESLTNSQNYGCGCFWFVKDL